MIFCFDGRLLIRTFALSLPLLLAGCGSLLSGAGPSRAAISADEGLQNYDLIDLSAETIGQYMRPLDKPLATHVAMPDVPEVRLMPGDVLRVLIADSVTEGAIFAPLALGGTTFDSVRVDNNGKISLPYVGTVSVAGEMLGEIEKIIRKRLAGVTSDVQVRVSVTGDLSGSVLVAGAVKAPGRFSALEGPLTLLDAINRAGGPLLEPHLIRVLVRTGSRSFAYNYEELLTGANHVVAPGAEIILERARKRFVAMGSVGDPGLHDLPSNNPSLLEVLGKIKGLDESKADPSGVFVFRMPAQPDPTDGLDDKPAAESDSTQARPIVFRLNMKDPAAIFLARQFLVRPEDAVYVTSAMVYEWQKIIAPIVQVMLLGRTISKY
ncbi:polysaccharide biosynthesis/export family protein [Achromobacter insolitus]|uniref:Soluble ligand binding domain-containing protein n=1 Tax=Achromobacter insolitus TaxID=217204 RepID=A0A6S7F5D8_9BURK|nr:polysaccharide biosynthesis/export family protein [Achromobacter insolitus]CAB3929639.1 hypothetical protein LMG6000_00692 [Achromobacter insolitus]CAB3935516.1 hypothetical protein LMG5997_02254 [Achromobacter insolitus]